MNSKTPPFCNRSLTAANRNAFSMLLALGLLSAACTVLVLPFPLMQLDKSDID